MVQVDVAWSYAFGATFAAAAGKSLARERDPFNNPVFTRLLLFLGIFFGPSGLYLLWANPIWETMQVAKSYADLPAWLVTLFAITNVTQGIIGYWVGWRLVRQQKFYQSHLNWMIAWVLFWFILVSGWDTTGYQRFLYDPALNGGELWSPGRHNGWVFFTGPVFQSLVVMGVLFAPMLRLGIINANYNDLKLKPGYQPGLRALMRIVELYYGSMFGLTLLLAIAASLIVIFLFEVTGSLWIGYLVGLPLSIALGFVVAVRKGGIFHRIAARLI